MMDAFVVAISITVVLLIAASAISLAIVSPENNSTKKSEIAVLPLPPTIGRKFVGVVDIKNRPYFYFYQKVSSGGKEFIQIPVRNVTIHKSTNESAYIIKRTRERSWDGQGWVFNFFVPKSLRIGCREVAYSIHVPSGGVYGKIKPK